jgi:hypothetical protein
VSQRNLVLWGDDPNQFLSKQQQVRLIAFSAAAAPVIVALREFGHAPLMGFGITAGGVLAVLVDLAILSWRPSFYTGRVTTPTIGGLVVLALLLTCGPIAYMILGG